ncbi:hypothetical protein [Tellurirhabdus bombi]|uniref:hypothetical protein n=1 Tax=Tellurirhabdus bombi TaxID=2907205 RepID=UPI001F4510A7|nr:hypothetical protein [Tellurirhabdus bombi]
MKKISALCALLLVIGLASFRQKNYDFRQTSWNMTKEQVIASEKAGKRIDLGKDRIRYTGIVLAGDTFSVDYDFERGKLVRANYNYRPYSIEQKECMTAYLDLEKVLSQKYGKPLEHLDLKALKKSAPGQEYALDLFDFSYLLKAWEQPRTIIALSYVETAKQDSCVVVVNYLSKIAPKLPKPKPYNISDF